MEDSGELISVRWKGEGEGRRGEEEGGERNGGKLNKREP